MLATSFESKHRFVDELRRDLEEHFHRGTKPPETITVSPEVFAVMRSEVGVNPYDRRFELLIALSDPREDYRWLMDPHVAFKTPLSYQVRIVPR